MSDQQITLYYHGRRSVDELLGALKAGSPAAAMAHKQLSLLHLDRLVASMISSANDIDALISYEKPCSEA